MGADFGQQLTGSGRDIRDGRVLAAMAAVPRDRFVPEELLHRAFDDNALPIGEEQTISQPFIVALMTEALGLRGGERVLEVGTGSGYQAAVLAELGCMVYSVERIASLSRRAAGVLAELGYAVHLRVGDGAEGWPDEAPFDAVIVTCAAARVADSWFAQLAPGGRMVVPVGVQEEVQELRLYEAGVDGYRRLSSVRFVPLL